MEKKMNHDALQFRCFQWLWNTHPNLRGLFWGVFNDIKQVEKITGPIGNNRRRIILSKMKSLGMIKGALDFMFYYGGVLYVMDFKVGPDRLSQDQKKFVEQIESQGGKGFEVRSLEGFMEIIDKILCGVITEVKVK